MILKFVFPEVLEPVGHLASRIEGNLGRERNRSALAAGEVDPFEANRRDAEQGGSSSIHHVVGCRERFGKELTESVGVKVDPITDRSARHFDDDKDQGFAVSGDATEERGYRVRSVRSVRWARPLTCGCQSSWSSLASSAGLAASACSVPTCGSRVALKMSYNLRVRKVA